MVPILYANQCAGCHVKDLQFDKRFDQPAPHDKPEVVQAFLIQKYSDYFAAHPGAMSEAVSQNAFFPPRLNCRHRCRTRARNGLTCKSRWRMVPVR